MSNANNKYGKCFIDHDVIIVHTSGLARDGVQK